MGPTETIGSGSKKSNRPMQSHRQLLQQIQRAHLRASAAPPRKEKGPSETIGPAAENFMGPF
jgi:hypothetical protein